MYKVSIQPHWFISYGNNEEIDAALLLRLLSSIQSNGSIINATKSLKLSYRHAWGLLRQAEEVFGGKLLEKQRGRGTQLTHLATTLLWADRRINARLSPTLQSLSSELETELEKSVEGAQKSIRIMARHGFAVEALIKHLAVHDLPIEYRYLNSVGALATLDRGECELAGFHLPMGDLENESIKHFNGWLKPDEHLLIHLAILNQGLFVASGNPKNINKLSDLTRNDIQFVNRQHGSGTRQLLNILLEKENINSDEINGFDTEEFTHSAIAAYIASGMADVGFGIETAARRFNLNFVELLKERYFFAVRKDFVEDEPIKKIISILKNDDFRAEINQIAGYDATEMGRIMTLDEAFPKH